MTPATIEHFQLSRPSGIMASSAGMYEPDWRERVCSMFVLLQFRQLFLLLNSVCNAHRVPAVSQS